MNRIIIKIIVHYINKGYKTDDKDTWEKALCWSYVGFIITKDKIFNDFASECVNNIWQIEHVKPFINI